MNVWTHFGGLLMAIFMLLHLSTILVHPEDHETWVDFELNQKYSEIAQVLNETQTFDEEEFLKELLNTEWIENWNSTHGHTARHHHASFYESLEHYISHSLDVLSYRHKMESLVGSCSDCLSKMFDLLRKVPTHVSTKVNDLLTQFHDQHYFSANEYFDLNK